MTTIAPFLGDWFAKELLALYGMGALGWIMWFVERRDNRAIRDRHETELKQLSEAFKTQAAEVNKTLGAAEARAENKARSESELAAALLHLSQQLPRSRR